MITENVLLALALTLIAGLSTGVGSVMAFFSKKFNPRFLCGALGFSAGVMIYISLVEILAEAKTSLGTAYGEKTGHWIAVLSFFAGIGIMALIDRLVPSYENPHEIHNPGGEGAAGGGNGKLLRMGVFSAVAIAVHNFPEGIATFMGAIKDPALGISIAAAVAIHNIPEGIAVSVPVYYATKSRKKALWLSFLSGLSEPVGAIVAFFLFRAIFSDATFGIVFAAVAGIMVYISLDELLPAAEEYGEHHIAIGGLVAGMAVMALSILLLH